MSSDSSVYAAANEFRRFGINCIPIRNDGTKRPWLATWAEYQSRPQTPMEITRLFKDRHVSIAALTGRVSGNFETIDVDDPSCLKPWLAKLPSELVAKLPIIRTPSGGYHVYYRCCEIGRNVKIACANVDGKRTTRIETRGEGGYVVTVGSVIGVHSDPWTYEQIAGPAFPDGLPTISAEERRMLFASARTFDECDIRTEIIAKEVARRRNHMVFGNCATDKVSYGLTWTAVLEPHGWTTDDGVYWKRPGKSHSHSAVLRMTEDGASQVFVVFSSNAGPLAATVGHETFSILRAYAALNFDGNAAAALAYLKSAKKSGVSL